MLRSKLYILALVVGIAMLAAQAADAAKIIINPVDPAGVGFNDPSWRAPVGGNRGHSLGQQRLNVFQKAADLWGRRLKSNVKIIYTAAFSPLTCSPTSAVLARSGPDSIFRDFTGAPKAATWFSVAEANSLYNKDLTPGHPDVGIYDPGNDDAIVWINGDIGVNPGCLTGYDWYYGLDDNAAGNQIDLLATLMHEMGHGLGFLTVMDKSTGALADGYTDIYIDHVYDNVIGKMYPQMTNGQRAASAVNVNNVVWTGGHVTWRAPKFLGPEPILTINTPGSIAGDYDYFQMAAFGPALTIAGVTGNVVMASPLIACSPITNNVAGSIALILRGTCTFKAKVLAAQNAGAIGVIIVNNAASGLPGMGNDATITTPITIPSIGVTYTLGVAIANAPGVNVTLHLDPTRMAGTDDYGRVKLYTPTLMASGSTLSHWDTSCEPSLLMEPNITAGLQAAKTVDLTSDVFRDIGWHVRK